VASSFATLRSKRFHKRMVRIGLAWAGYGSEWMEGDEVVEAADQLRPIVSWKSRLVQIKSISKGTPVGYGSRWTAKRNSVIGLIPVGYADGYPMGLGSRDSKHKTASVAVFAEGDSSPIGYAPVIGAVNMDQITIDLTDLSAKFAKIGSRLAVGGLVELISPDRAAPNHLSNLSRMAGTIPHEMLCRLNPRLKRVYTAPVAGEVEHVAAAGALVG
jgi:alanine racemase